MKYFKSKKLIYEILPKFEIWTFMSQQIRKISNVNFIYPRTLRNKMNNISQDMGISNFGLYKRHPPWSQQRILAAQICREYLKSQRQKELRLQHRLRNKKMRTLRHGNIKSNRMSNLSMLDRDRPMSGELDATDILSDLVRRKTKTAFLRGIMSRI